MGSDEQQQAMTAERLAVIRAMIALTDVGDAQFAAITELLAEVERLRAREAALASQARYEREERDRREAALMAVARAVAEVSIESSALMCGCNLHGWRPSASPVVWLLNQPVHHEPDCIFTQARALLAATDEADKQPPEQPPCPVCGTPGRHVTSGWWCDGCNLPFRRPGEAAGQE